jgi:thiol-disulfide isomerase/thioredoxin
VRAQPHTIPAPPFPRGLTWLNVAPLRMDKQLGRPVLVEFWDFCRVNSLRTLPYLTAWHERYAHDGLRVIGIHAGGFLPARDEANVRRAVERLRVPYPVVIDARLELWDMYGNEGWPGRYLWDTGGSLFSLHYAPGVLLPAQTEDRPGAYSGPYEAGGVWAVLEGEGEVVANGRTLAVSEPGCFPLVEHPCHTAGELELRVGPGVVCHATCFTPGVPAPRDRVRPAAAAGAAARRAR